MAKLTIPGWVEAGYYPKYLDNAPDINQAHGKIATTHVYTTGFANSVMHAKGFSHVAGLGSATTDVKNKRCFTPLADFRDGGNNVTNNPDETSARNFANSLAGNFTKNSVFVDEFMDGAGAIYNANYSSAKANLLSATANLKSIEISPNIIGQLSVFKILFRWIY